MACPAKYQPYTDADNAWFRQHYTTATKQEVLARFPGRPWHALKKQACCLKATRARGERPQVYSTWSPARLAVLREHYPTKGSIATAALLGLPRGAVRAAACRLKLSIIPKGKLAKAPRAAKPPKPPKPAKPSPAPRSVAVKPAPAPRPVAPKRSPGTPVLNAQKAATQQRNAPKPVAITAAEVAKLPYAHPGRMAYMLKGTAGWQEWQQQQAA